LKTTGTSTRNEKDSLGRFELQTIAVDGQMMSDTSMKASVILCKCVLDDTRPGREAGITK